MLQLRRERLVLRVLRSGRRYGSLRRHPAGRWHIVAHLHKIEIIVLRVRRASIGESLQKFSGGGDIAILQKVLARVVEKSELGNTYPIRGALVALLFILYAVLNHFRFWSFWNHHHQHGATKKRYVSECFAAPRSIRYAQLYDDRGAVVWREGGSPIQGHLVLPASKVLDEPEWQGVLSRGLLRLWLSHADRTGSRHIWEAGHHLGSSRFNDVEREGEQSRHSRESLRCYGGCRMCTRE